jgi:hypothetical protein
MRNRAVDQNGPQAEEEEVGRKAHALDDRAGNQRHRDDGQGALIADLQVVWDLVASRAVTFEADTAQEEPDVSPIQSFPGANAREYPTTAQSTPTNPSEMKLIIIVFNAFLERTSPP